MIIKKFICYSNKLIDIIEKSFIKETVFFVANDILFLSDKGRVTIY